MHDWANCPLEGRLYIGEPAVVLNMHAALRVRGGDRARVIVFCVRQQEGSRPSAMVCFVVVVDVVVVVEGGGCSSAGSGVRV